MMILPMNTVVDIGVSGTWDMICHDIHPILLFSRDHDDSQDGMGH
jgi:hypothetical protein